MNIWVHKLTVDGAEKFITNADFKPMYDANGCKMPSEMRSSVVASKEALNCTLEDIEIMEEEGL